MFHFSHTQFLCNFCLFIFTFSAFSRKLNLRVDQGSHSVHICTWSLSFSLFPSSAILHIFSKPFIFSTLRSLYVVFNKGNVSLLFHQQWAHTCSVTARQQMTHLLYSGTNLCLNHFMMSSFSESNFPDTVHISLIWYPCNLLGQGVGELSCIYILFRLRHLKQDLLGNSFHSS